MSLTNQTALAGIKVAEIGHGAAMSYCGRLLKDVGASVSCFAAPEDGTAPRADCVADDSAFAAYLQAGKSHGAGGRDRQGLQRLSRDFDVVLVGEDTRIDTAQLEPKKALIDLSWFGGDGPYKDWKGTDLIVQVLTAMPHLAGPVEGPPLYAGDRHSVMVAGGTAYIAALAGILASTGGVPRRFSISTFEANLVLSEMDIHFVERDQVPLKRHGINRFSPNGPVGIYKCQEGWIGITATTPDQWRSLCAALGMEKEAADVSLATREMRFARLDEVEQAMTAALSRRTADEWGAVLRRYRVPGVVVPDADDILRHPIFKARQSLARFRMGERELTVPRTPFGLTATPSSVDLDADPHEAAPAASPMDNAKGANDTLPLEGLIVVDFTMGWAGPLASRLLADLGADVLKIEAGRYPDWWRGVNWTPEYIAAKQYENAKGYCALNRGKYGVSLDLTNPKGRDIALALIARSEAVIENQAAGVMNKLGLGYDAIAAARPDIVMTSMSAFGTGNEWSDTRAYGSTLEQGSGLPSFMGLPGTPPTMAHLAYGDPVGGLFGCAALLTALVHKRRTGKGQYVNVSMVEAMLQFASPALLQHQLAPQRPLRLGNRSLRFAPHGIYPAARQDRWLAIAIDGAESFDALARIIGRPEWINDPGFRTLDQRKAREDELDRAIADWSRMQEPHEAASELQALGIAAAPVLHTEEIVENPHLDARGFFIDLVREHSGPQRQAGIAVVQDGKRLGARRAAPLLGEHSEAVLDRHAGIAGEAYASLVRDGIVSFAPASLRSAVVQPAPVQPARQSTGMERVSQAREQARTNEQV